MSLNKVLNRPLFRKQALKKGHLQPITAQNGSFIGPVQPGVPAVLNRARAGTTVGSSYVPKSTSLTVRPGIGSRFLRAIGTGPFTFGLDTTMSTLDRLDPENKMGTPLKTGLGVGAGLGLNALALRTMPALLAPGIIPAGVGIGASLGVMKLADLAKEGRDMRKAYKAMSPAEKKEFERLNRLRSTSMFEAGVTDKELFGNIDTKRLDEIVKKEKQKPTTIPNPGAGRPSLRVDQEKNVDIATAPDNITKLGTDEVIDTAKIAENAAVNIDSGRGGDSASAVARQQANLPKPAISDDDDDKAETGTGTGTGTGTSTETANQDSVNATSTFKAQLDLAKEIAKEMRVGRTSNANLVFLSNLASGLLTGTTKKSGVGGALEVFGAALGPAVNNMVMVKMKEDEIEQNLLGRALEFSTDFLEAQNQGYDMPDTQEVGVIQYTNEAGRTVNVPGRILKDGTKQRASGAADPKTGLYTYVTVDPSLNFIPNSDANKETLELAKSIAGKYAAVNLINRSLGIIESGGAQAGVTGAIGLYGGRISEALGDVFSFASISGDSKAELRSAGKAMFNIEQKKVANALVSSGEFKDVTSALKYLNSRNGLGSYQTNYNDAINNAKKRLKDGSTLDYERLAINETVLVYKLANSLKSKDRLTQKDIEMAKGLVKVFPLLRGERNVIASLTATAETILDDIKQQERLYERAGGSSEYLLNERKAYGLLPQGTTIDTMTDFESKEFERLVDNIEKMTDEDFEKIFPPEFFK